MMSSSPRGKEAAQVRHDHALELSCSAPVSPSDGSGALSSIAFAACTAACTT